MIDENFISIDGIPRNSDDRCTFLGAEKVENDYCAGVGADLH